MTILNERQEVINKWTSLYQNHILSQIHGDSDLILFGAGEVSQLIMCYMPRIFSQLKFCFVTDCNGIRLNGLETYHIDSLKDPTDYQVLIGVSQNNMLKAQELLLAYGYKEDQLISIYTD